MPRDSSRRSRLDFPAPAALLLRLAVFAGLWWMLAEGEWRTWGLGVVVIAAAFTASLLLWPARAPRISLVGLALFVPFFLWQSLRGGVIVAKLALTPRLRLRPQLTELTLRLPPGPARVLLADALSLMPGTVSVGLVDDILTVHLLDRDLVSLADLQHAESRVASLFGLRLAADATQVSHD